jgi:5-methylcytosine-specific restriction endonuclease McrA
LATMAEKLKKRIGEKASQWLGGKSFEPYTPAFNKELKESIRKRDEWRCQKCGVPQVECTKKLTVHHIDYNKANTIPTNLISLCVGCNAKVNSNREYWTKYFQIKLLNKAYESSAWDYKVLSTITN